MKTTYELGWSYPSSPNAVEAKMSETGCWTVEQYIGGNPPTALFHFKPDEKEKALEMISKYTKEHVESERNNLRKQQAERVMPLIGGLLDAWEGMSKEMRTDPELGEVRSYMSRIDAAMEGWDL